MILRLPRCVDSFFTSIDGNNKAAEIASLRLFAVKTAFLVRVTGLEPAASWSQTTRSTI